MPRIPQSFDEETNRDPVQDLIWSVGLKATSARMAVAGALLEEHAPVSVAELQKRLKSVSAASIYRTLETFVEKGVVSRINTGRAHASYELISGRKHHHHVICTTCGDMEDVEAGKDCVTRKTEHRILADSRKFASVSSHSLEFFGLCDKCASSGLN